MNIYGSLSRYDSGMVEVKHRGKTVTTSVGTTMDDIIVNLEKTYSFQKGKVPVFHKHRPDLISDIFYDSPKYWWFILQFNEINDPFTDLNPGDDIFIPDL